MLLHFQLTVCALLSAFETRSVAVLWVQLLELGLADTRCTSVPTMVLASGTAVAITGRGFDAVLSFLLQ
ncbi:hypothetical protein Nepgr_003968 [Nepenthes gracilis]|uniref:Secreted protein n=1 Tax=Nepenthes gracilis TaxID=150966 RepID=A0AAD3XEF1_NEPGR|nr:hypothetical protein Nepgr_003968 [Nepenthes gracilis]